MVLYRHQNKGGKNLVDWDYYNKFDEVNDKYLPCMGEGDTEVTPILFLYEIIVYYSESQYEDLLKKLADLTLNEEFLGRFNIPKKDTIYECKGPFEFKEYEEDEKDDYWDDGCPLEEEE